jgi:hypothetical protein
MVCKLMWKIFKTCSMILGVKKKKKKKNFEKTQIWKGTFQFLFTWELVKQISIWKYHAKRRLMKSKVVPLKQDPNQSISLE